MKSDTPLAYVEFQVAPNMARCELYAGTDDTVFKLASGLLAPFKTHLPLMEEQITQGATSVRLEPPDPHNAAWFTKGTVERFIRFVRTPEVLDRLSTIEAERIQLEETLHAQLNYSLESFESSPNAENTHAEGSKQWLLKALDSRLLVLQKEQETAVERANAAGFTVDNMGDLSMFSECFGAARLGEASVKFRALCEKRQTKQDLQVVNATQFCQPVTTMIESMMGDLKSLNGQYDSSSGKMGMNRDNHLASGFRSAHHGNSCMQQLHSPPPAPPPLSDCLVVSSHSPSPLPPPALTWPMGCVISYQNILDNKSQQAFGVTPFRPLPPTVSYIPEGQQPGIVQQVSNEICQDMAICVSPQREEDQTPYERNTELSLRVTANRLSVQSLSASRHSLSPMESHLGPKISSVGVCNMHGTAITKQDDGCSEPCGYWSEEIASDQEESLKKKAETGQIRVQDVIGLFESKKIDNRDAKQVTLRNGSRGALSKSAMFRRWTGADVVGQPEEGQTKAGNKDGPKNKMVSEGEGSTDVLLCSDVAKVEGSGTDHAKGLGNVYLSDNAVGLKIGEKEESSDHLNYCDLEMGNHLLYASDDIVGDQVDAGTLGEDDECNEVDHESQAVDFPDGDTFNKILRIELTNGLQERVPMAGKVEEPSSKFMFETKAKVKTVHALAGQKKVFGGKQSERPDPLVEAHVRAGKLHTYEADLQKSKKEEEERKRIKDLKIQRQERIIRGSPVNVSQSNVSHNVRTPPKSLVSMATSHKPPSPSKTHRHSSNVARSKHCSSNIDSRWSALTHSVPSLQKHKKECDKDMTQRMSWTRSELKRVTDGDQMKCQGRKNLTLSTAGRRCMPYAKVNKVESSQASSLSKLGTNKQPKKVLRPRAPKAISGTKIVSAPNVVTPSFMKKVPKDGISTSPVHPEKVAEESATCSEKDTSPISYSEAELLAGTTEISDVLSNKGVPEHGNMPMEATASSKLEGVEVLTDDSYLVFEKSKEGNGDFVDYAPNQLEEQEETASKEGSPLFQGSGGVSLEMMSDCDAEESVCASICHVLPPNYQHIETNSNGRSGSCEDKICSSSLLHVAEHYDPPMAHLSRPFHEAGQITSGESFDTLGLNHHNAFKANATASIESLPRRGALRLHEAIQQAHSPEASPPHHRSRKRWVQDRPQKSPKDQAKGLKRLLLLRKKSNQSSSSNWNWTSPHSEGDDDVSEGKDSALSKMRLIDISPKGAFMSEGQYEITSSNSSSKVSRSFFSLSTFLVKNDGKL